ncbi:Uncharacterised protein [uncultured archaeon]|nr:Uncharacterised protein [uncultured archaeon]
MTRVQMATSIRAVNNEKQAEYSRWEKVAGRDPWYAVLGYRLLMMFVDIFSVAGVFAGIMTWILIKSMNLLLKLATIKLAASAVLGYITFGMMILAAFIFAWTYFAARKFTPPVVEALCDRIAGKAHDIQVTGIAEDVSHLEATMDVNKLYDQLTKEPPKPAIPEGWPEK